MPTIEARSGTVARMVALRRKVDATLRSRKTPKDWTPEWVIYGVLRGIALLERDGAFEPDAVRQVDVKRRFNVLPPGADAVTPEEYLLRLLRGITPGYLTHGSELLADAVRVARRGLRKLPPAPWNTPTGTPPPDWDWSKIPPGFEYKTIERLQERLPLVPFSTYDEEVADLLVRMQEGDELWNWSSPSITWRARMGRHGIALVRNGRVLTEVVTGMN